MDKVALGRWLFRHRSITPLPLIGAVGLYLALGGLAAAQAWLPPRVYELTALAVILTGVVLRLVVAGRAPAGTSGRGKRLEARQLITFGPYAWTRNPLYFANLLLCLGLLLEVGSPLIAALTLLFFYLQYFPVIEAEEAFLRERFGDAYVRWCEQVPRFWPRRPVDPPPVPGRIRWIDALLRDADTWFAALGGFALWRWLAGRPPLFGFESTLGLILFFTLLYLAAKVWKRARRAPAGAS